MKKATKSILVITALLTACVLIVCCKSAPPPSNHANSYSEALKQYPATVADDTLVDKFTQVFGDLKSPDLGSAIDRAYASELYFNDTLNSFTSRQALKKYLQHTAKNLRSCSVDIEDIARSGNDVYLRWRMVMELDIKGREITSDTVGMTHLRFNGEGQITLHQDYWDGIDGLYQHLPYVGFWIRKLREKL